MNRFIFSISFSFHSGNSKICLLLLGQLPQEVQARLESATLAELEQWSSVLLTANSLEEVFKDVEQDHEL